MTDKRSKCVSSSTNKGGESSKDGKTTGRSSQGSTQDTRVPEFFKCVCENKAFFKMHIKNTPGTFQHKCAFFKPLSKTVTRKIGFSKCCNSSHKGPCLVKIDQETYLKMSNDGRFKLPNTTTPPQNIQGIPDRKDRRTGNNKVTRSPARRFSTSLSSRADTSPEPSRSRSRSRSKEITLNESQQDGAPPDHTQTQTHAPNKR